MPLGLKGISGADLIPATQLLTPEFDWPESLV